MFAFFKEKIQQLDEAFGASFLGRYFKLNERHSTLSIEFRGAVATFLSMAYILAVNPRIISDSGGPCPGPPDDDDQGVYLACVENVKRELITSTALASLFGCLLMGAFANLPVALAPGMGMNAYFTYNVVGFWGSSSVSYEAAITAVMIEGAIFFVLAITGIRYALVRLVPEPIRLATPAAIGAFLAHLGLQTAEGLGVVVGDTATAVTLGACPVSKRTPLVAYTNDCRDYGYCLLGDAYTCDVEHGVMTSAFTWMGILGTALILVMLAYKYVNKQRFCFLARRE